MLEIIKYVINYIPRESVEDMLNVKLASIVSFETEPIVSKETTTPIFGGMVGLPGYSEEGLYPEISLKVIENKVYEEKIEKSKHPTDILKTILDRFEKDFNEGKNYDEKFTISKDRLNNLKNVAMLIVGCVNVIAMHSRSGPGNVVILPKHIYETMDKKLIYGMTPTVLCNPLEEYDDRIFILRKEKKSQTHEQKYHLLTDSKIPNNRELKINKLLNTKNREINYAIVPVHGHNETIIVIKFV